MDIAYIYKSKQMSPTNMLYILSLKIINQLDAGSYTHTLINTIQHLLNYIYFYGIYFTIIITMLLSLWYNPHELLPSFIFTCP